MIKILIIDDHEITRKGLTSVFEQVDDFEIIGELPDGSGALSFIKANQPDIIILDVKMPGKNGVDVAEAIKENHTDIKVAILSAFSDSRMIEKALSLNLEGYMLKDASSDELIKAIRLIDGGEKYLHPAAASKIMNNVTDFSDDGSKREHNLTERELRVLQLICKGRTNRDIASNLYVGEETVKTHVANILLKLSKNSRTEAAIYAIKNGLFEDYKEKL